MARIRIRLDHKGMAEMLKSAGIRAAVEVKAAEVHLIAMRHDAIIRNGMTVERRSYTTDRAAVAVTITHPGGRNVENKHGVLATAARRAGLEVTDRRERIAREVDRANRRHRARTRKAARMQRRFEKAGLL
ncbi:hypothetical protein AB0H43_03005 [Hamadaea sp. NPDC050747]|uniref:hypothetical protein n=1 Tax=Hamadaea sp. NPDC050747 TaxID=3155789 RepID=UPI0033C8891F